MPHRALVHLFARQAAQGARGATTLQFASLGFDVSFQEMFGTWGAGGTLVVADDDARRDPALLLRRLVDARVERAFLPPAVLQQLAVAALAEQSYPTSVREVIAAGEPLKISREVAGLFARIDACVLRNQYGPTETHVVTEQVLCGDPQTWPGLPSIGRPIADARIYVLDRHRRPVPVGVRGELHVGGACVARGYLRRPSLTAERFIPDPFGGPGERLYCTGDLARFRADGTIELLGRTDDQIKLRGHRIEPGEVEEALRDHPSVREAVVVARDVRSGDRRLVAYVVPAPGRSAEVGDLRRALGRRLPEAMIPSIFVALDALPLTSNRKVDRRALPDPDAARLPAARAPVAPRYSIETTIAEIWCVVLGVDRVGVHDNFFELGGHSLLAAQIVARVRDAYGVSVPLRRVFEAPSSVADLAVAVLEGLAAGRDREELDRMLTEIERGAAEPRVHESGESP